MARYEWNYEACGVSTCTFDERVVGHVFAHGNDQWIAQPLDMPHVLRPARTVELARLRLMDFDRKFNGSIDQGNP